MRDLERAFRFWTEVLGAVPRARWDGGAYLTVGPLWLCLSLDATAAPAADYTHLAFSVDDLATAAARLRASGAAIWKEDRSEGASLYFLDPDGHRLELHEGTLETRLAACRARPYAGMVFFDPA